MPCIAILISTSKSKNPCSFLLWLYSLYNKIRNKGKIVSKVLISTNKLGVALLTCSHSYSGGVNRRIPIQAGPRQKMQESIKKTTKSKGAQAIEHLLARMSP
jgi:hypothetical protein